jgi:hypothetical protein
LDGGGWEKGKEECVVCFVDMVVGVRRRVGRRADWGTGVVPWYVGRGLEANSEVLSHHFTMYMI